jgi:hypothetical protein
VAFTGLVASRGGGSLRSAAQSSFPLENKINLNWLLGIRKHQTVVDGIYKCWHPDSLILWRSPREKEEVRA